MKGFDMNVTYKNPGFEHSINSILLFQTNEQTPYWSEAVFYFYPQINKEELLKCEPGEQAKYFTDKLARVYQEILPEIEEKAIRYNEHFLKYENQINDALSDAFETDTRVLFNDLTGYIGMNPICPRFLKEHYFDIFYKNSERGALGMSIHEMIHYVWFHVWNRFFGDSYDEYEAPSLKWILSEMVVESIMSDKRLSTINPYYPREQGGCVYNYFLDMVIDGKLILDTFSEMYKENRIIDFMQSSFIYCQKHENEIRLHIAKAETGF